MNSSLDAICSSNPLCDSYTFSHRTLRNHYLALDIKLIRLVNANCPLSKDSVLVVLIISHFWAGVLGYNLKNDGMISVPFQGKPFNIKVIQVYAPTSNAEEAEVEWFFEVPQDLLELIPPKDVIFIIGD